MKTKNLLFTNWFADDYKGNIAGGGVVSWDEPQKVGLKLYSRTPQFTDYINENFKVIRGISDINQNPEWVPCTSTLTSKVAGTSGDLYVMRDTVTNYLKLVDSSSNVLALETRSGWYFTDSNSQEIVQAAVVYLIDDVSYGGTIHNPVLFATTQGIGSNTVAHTGTVFGQSNSQVTISDSQYLLSFSPDPSPTEFSAGYMLLYLPPAQWESAHAQHLWIQPQRVNLIANPSFEKSGSGYWRVGNTRPTGTASISRSAGGVGGSERPYSGQVTGTTGTGIDNGVTVLESNLFPKTNNWHSISLFVKNGDNTTRSISIGLVARNNMDSEATYFAPPAITLNSEEGFKALKVLVNVPDDVTDLQLRLEFSGLNFWVDNVLVDPHEGQYTYFDGNSTDGLIGDFRWMGEISNGHFSIWYNNFVNSQSRLMGAYDDTIDHVYKPGLVEEWVPTGSNIIAHWNAVTPLTPLGWIGDSFYEIAEVNGTPVSTITNRVDITYQGTFPHNTRTLTRKDRLAIDSMS